MKTIKSVLVVSAAAALALGMSACTPPGGSSGGGSTEITKITSPVTAKDVAKLGDVTLKVLADAGEEDTLKKELIPEYEKKYPNVTVDVQFRAYDDIVKTEANTLSGSNVPDVAEGAQGYALDSVLVKAGLIRPIDDLAKAYKWYDRYGKSTLSEFQWDAGGKHFGSGKLYGISPVSSMVGVYYNKTKLSQLGLDVPSSFDEFAADLQKAKQAGEQPIVLGDALKSPGLHLFGVMQGQYVDPADVRAWISGKKGTTFETPKNVKTATTLQDWATKGYFGEGFNGVAEDDAVSAFANGKGVFLIGGTWQVPNMLKGSQGDKVGFFAMPPGESGLHVASGSLGMGWHISSKSKLVPAAAAFIAMITSDEYAQKLADLGRIPVLATGIDAPNPLFAEAAAGSTAILKDGGNTYSFDWATSTMMSTMGGAVQELMTGRVSPEEFVKPIQADWEKFQSGRQ